MLQITVDVFFSVVALGGCEFSFRETRCYYDEVPSEREFLRWVNFDAWLALMDDLAETLPGVEVYSITQERYECERWVWEKRRR